MDAVSGSIVDTQLGDPAPDRLCVANVAEGDTIEVEIEGVGVLKNTARQAEAA